MAYTRQLLVVQALQGLPLTVYGRGEQTRSFCYVTDMIDGLARLMQSGEQFSGPVNLGNPNEHTIAELAETIVRLTESNSTIVFAELPQDDPMQRRPDIELARAELGWQPQVSLEEGLTSTIEHFDGLLRYRGARLPSRRANTPDIARVSAATRS